MVWDTFLLNDELDMLECRLRTLEDVVDRFVIVEADVSWMAHPKPSYYLDNRERFAAWEDRIVHVWATGLNTTDPDPFRREHEQREWTSKGLEEAQPDDLVIHSDVDEIPFAHVVRDLDPEEMVVLEHHLCCFAVDWLHPVPWRGAVAARWRDMPGSWRGVRKTREMGTLVPNAGWHFSWIGGTEANYAKQRHSPHQEQTEEVHEGLADDNRFLREGVYIGGVHLIAVDVDETWPEWIRERKCPKSWFRPR